MNGNALIAFEVVEKKEGFGVGRSSWSVVIDSLRGHCQEMTETKGQGSPGEQTEPRKLLRSSCSSSEARENFPY